MYFTLFENIKRTRFSLIRITEITILVCSRHTLSVQPILEGGYEVWNFAIKIGGVPGIWPPSTSILDDSMWHNPPHIVNETPQLLFLREINGIFPQITILQSTPIPTVVLAAFGVIGNPCIASSLRLERRRSNAPRLYSQAATGSTASSVAFSLSLFSEAISLRLGNRCTGVGGSSSSLGVRYCKAF